MYLITILAHMIVRTRGAKTDKNRSPQSEYDLDWPNIRENRNLSIGIGKLLCLFLTLSLTMS